MVKRLIVGISGASGAPLAVDLLKTLASDYKEIETHLVITRGGEMTLLQECGMTPDDLLPLVSHLHQNNQVGATIASGSFKTLGMVVVPCSMKSVAGIVSGYSDSLLLRAADVTIKERRKLILVAREAPLSAIHLRNLYEVSQLGAVILPPMLTYYHSPQKISDCTHHIVLRILSQLGLEQNGYEWEGISCMIP